MPSPIFPLICISKDYFLNIVPSETHFSKVATSVLIDPGAFDGTILFDKDGKRWGYKQISDKFKNTFLTRLLARSFYNPLLEAKVVWIDTGSYDLTGLKGQIKECVDKDDDILTQFAPPDLIRSTIDKATTFDEILTCLNKYIFDVNEEEFMDNADRN